MVFWLEWFLLDIGIGTIKELIKTGHTIFHGHLFNIVKLASSMNYFFTGNGEK